MTITLVLQAGGMLLGMLRDQRQSPSTRQRRQQIRLGKLVEHARCESPFYRALYRDLPWGDLALRQLPTTDKRRLMSAFDDWVCDPRVTRGDVEEFVTDPRRLGSLFNDKYFVCTSSGTTGRPGLFLHDARAMSVYLGLLGRLDAAWLSASDLARLAGRRGRVAAVLSTGGHFAGAGWVELMRRQTRRWNRSYRLMSAQQPIAQLVAQLNAFDPAVVLVYPSSLGPLADQARSGSLTIAPVFIEVGGEHMSGDRRRQAGDIFGCPVRTVYGASEFDPIAFSCTEDWLHVNNDWAILEPIDSSGAPTPPGHESDSVLLTNLANLVQPIIRYDLGDSVIQRPDPCPCGSRLPAIRVAGRQDEVLGFRTTSNDKVRVSPLLLASIIDRVGGLEISQLVQTGSDCLEVRFAARAGTDADAVWVSIDAGLREFLRDQGLANVRVVRSDSPPTAPGAGGKFRRILREPSS